MIFDQEDLRMHVVATIVGIVTGLLWWGTCIALFDFGREDLWMPVMGCILSANLGMLSTRG